MKSPMLAGKKLVFAPILRAGMGLLEGMLDLVPSARVAHIGLYRDPRTLVAVEYYLQGAGRYRRAACDRARSDAGDRKHRGRRDRSAEGKPAPSRSASCACWPRPQGVEKFRAHHPDVHIWTAAIDERLDDHGYIVPGLGDAGDRMYGTK